MSTVITIIVPVYIVPLEYLRKCFDSLITQTLQECEFIVVSDGAPDAECSVCEEYANKDARFKFFRREHAGVSATRNFGITQAQGEYVTFVDSDDWIDSATCKECYSFLRSTSCEVLIFSFVEHHPNKTKPSQKLFSINKEHIIDKELDAFKRNTIHLSRLRYLPIVLSVCKIYKRSFLTDNQITFDNSLSIGEDRVFNFQVFNRAKHVAYLDKTFYHYNILSSSSRNRCSDNGIYQSLLYIQKLQELSEGLYDNELGLEAISEIWVFTRKCPIKKEYLEILQKDVASCDFQDLIKNIRTYTKNPLLNLDIWAFKRQMKFTIQLHLMISAFQRILRKIISLR